MRFAGAAVTAASTSGEACPPESDQVLKYHPRGEPVPAGWERVHDFRGEHWSQWCHHGVYAVLIRKVKP